jgi:protein-arginine kinase activator protein McsA
MYTDLICCHKLTKKFLMSLETGLFICSNVYDDDTESLYSIYQNQHFLKKLFLYLPGNANGIKLKKKL